jgi:hypothetical protein
MGLYDPPGTAAYQLGSNLRSKLTGLWGGANNQALAQSNPTAKVANTATQTTQTQTPTTTTTQQPTILGKSQDWWTGDNSFIGKLRNAFGGGNTETEEKTPEQVTEDYNTQLRGYQTQPGANPFISPAVSYMTGQTNPTSVYEQNAVTPEVFATWSPEMQKYATDQFNELRLKANTEEAWTNYLKNLIGSIGGRYDTAAANIQNFATNNQGMLPNGQALVDQGWNSFQEKYQPTVDQLNNASLMAAEQARKNANYGTQQQIKYANEIAGGRGITGSGIYQSLVQQAGQNNARNYQQNVVDIYNANADRINSTVSGVLANLQSQGMQIDANTKTQVFNTVMQAMMDMEKAKVATQLQYETNAPSYLESIGNNNQVPASV